MSIGLKADPGGTSGAIQINGSDTVVITSAGSVAATTFAGNLVGNASTATQFANTTGTAPVYGARAWVNFDGTRNAAGAVDATNTNRFIRASGNVSSVLRNGVGDYTITFATAMVDADYCAVGTATKFNPRPNDGNVGIQFKNVGGDSSGQLAGSLRLSTPTPIGNGLEDNPMVSVAVFR